MIILRTSLTEIIIERDWEANFSGQNITETAKNMFHLKGAQWLSQVQESLM